MDAARDCEGVTFDMYGGRYGKRLATRQPTRLRQVPTFDKAHDKVFPAGDLLAHDLAHDDDDG